MHKVTLIIAILLIYSSVYAGPTINNIQCGKEYIGVGTSVTKVLQACPGSVVTVTGVVWNSGKACTKSQIAVTGFGFYSAKPKYIVFAVCEKVVGWQGN